MEYSGTTIKIKYLNLPLSSFTESLIAFIPPKEAKCPRSCTHCIQTGFFSFIWWEDEPFILFTWVKGNSKITFVNTALKKKLYFRHFTKMLHLGSVRYLTPNHSSVFHPALRSFVFFCHFCVSKKTFSLVLKDRTLIRIVA